VAGADFRPLLRTLASTVGSSSSVLFSPAASSSCIFVVFLLAVAVTVFPPLLRTLAGTTGASSSSETLFVSSSFAVNSVSCALSPAAVSTSDVEVDCSASTVSCVMIASSATSSKVSPSSALSPAGASASSLISELLACPSSGTSCCVTASSATVSSFSTLISGSIFSTCGVVSSSSSPSPFSCSMICCCSSACSSCSFASLSSTAVDSSPSSSSWSFLWLLFVVRLCVTGKDFLPLRSTRISVFSSLFSEATSSTSC